MATAPEENRSPFPPPIRLEQVSYVANETVLLDHVDLTVPRGEIFAVMGRSGAGKTTLLRLIMGLIKPLRGRILIHGQDITELDERELDCVRAGLGLVFQGAALFDSLTVGENVALGLVEHRLIPRQEVAGRVRRLLEMVDVAQAERLRPAELSGGMRKRVGIARALAMEPRIVLYDEPTAGLDPIYATAIDNLIVHLREQMGVTSMIVSHDVASLRRVCDRAALLHRGRFLALGSLPELEASDDPAVRQFLAGLPEGPMTDG
jgi:phospholipid/cholesterol/gamma-HCH transport system ATP-binding protein